MGQDEKEIDKNPTKTIAMQSLQLCPSGHIHRMISDIRSINKFPPFLIKNWAFIVKERYMMFYSKYCPLLATTFFYLSGSIRIPRQKNASSFEAIHESTQFLVSSYDVKCCSDRPYAIDRNE